MADPPIRVGATARHPNGSVVTWNGTTWVQTVDPRTPGGLSGRTVPREDAPAIAGLRKSAEAGAAAERTYGRVAEANRRLQPGPWRGRFLDAAIPSEEGGILDTLGGFLIGGPARMVGAITPREVDDYQTVQRARNQGVLAEQQSQAGVQTEGDAARMAMAGLNATNTTTSNETAITQGTQDAIRAQARTAFYTAWASKYGGLNATNPQGFNVDAVWNGAQPRIIAHFIEQRGGAHPAPPAGRARPPVIRRVR